MQLNPEITKARSLRRALGLTQFSVSVGTGINLSRISKAESGKLQLEQSEMTAIAAFLRDMWNIHNQPEGMVGVSEHVEMSA